METVLDPPRASVTVHQADAPSRSAASWSAIFAGAVVAIAVSAVLIALGTGLGFAAVSPWQNQGVSATTFAVTTAIWLIVVQWLSAAVGGYLAGRLRTRWIGTHVHEVFFRDTAHGFVTWAVATVVVAALTVASVTATVGGGVRAAATVTAGAAGGVGAGAAGAGSASQASETGSGTPAYTYGMDKLFRPSDPATATAGASAGVDPRAEVAHVVGQAVTTDGNVPEADRTYLAGLVAARTGVTADEAQRRVNDFIATANQIKDQVKAKADEARKAAAKTAIFTALSMAIGAFIACLTAVMGGRLRDEHP
jgi:hypothetical protein